MYDLTSRLSTETDESINNVVDVVVVVVVVVQLIQSETVEPDPDGPFQLRPTSSIRRPRPVAVGNQIEKKTRYRPQFGGVVQLDGTPVLDETAVAFQKLDALVRVRGDVVVLILHVHHKTQEKKTHQSSNKSTCQTRLHVGSCRCKNKTDQ